MEKQNKIKISYDYLDNHSVWRVEEAYQNLRKETRFILAKNGITLQKLSASWDMSDYIKNILELAEENPGQRCALQEFSEELKLIDSLRDEDSSTEYDFAVETLRAEVQEWDKQHRYAVSNTEYDVIAYNQIGEYAKTRDGLGSSWWCEISDNEILYSNGEKIYGLTTEEENYIPYLCESFRYSKRIPNHHEVILFFKESGILDKVEFANFIVEIYHIFDDNDDFTQWLNYKEWNSRNPELNSETLSHIKEIYLKGNTESFLENLTVLAKNWEGTGLELLAACDVFNKK